MKREVLVTNDFDLTNRAIDALRAQGVGVQTEDIDDGNVSRLVVDETEHAKAMEALAALGIR